MVDCLVIWKIILFVYNQRHSMNTKSSNSNIVCPRYKREMDGGRALAVTGTKLWNSLPLELRKNVSLKVFNLKLPSIFCLGRSVCSQLLVRTQ